MVHKQAPQHDSQQIQDVFFSHGSFSSVFFQNFKIVNVISLSDGSYLKKTKQNTILSEIEPL